MRVLTSQALQDPTNYPGHRAESGSFVAFAVGKDSEHAVIDLETPEGTYRLQAGEVLRLAVTGQVTISSVLGGTTYLAGGGCNLGEVYCYEPGDCVPDRIKRPLVIRGRTADVVDAAAVTQYIPTRRHVRILCVNAEAAAITLAIYGIVGDPDDDPAAVVQLGSTYTIAAGTKRSIDVGGTDREELWDQLQLVWDSAGEGTITVTYHVDGYGEWGD